MGRQIILPTYMHATPTSLLLHPPRHLVDGVLREWVGVSEADVELVRSGARTKLIEQLHNALSLDTGPSFDGGSPSNLGILLHYLGSASLGNEWCQFAAGMQNTAME